MGREPRRWDALARGTAAPPLPPALPTSLPPPAAAQPSAGAPGAVPSDQPLSVAPFPGRDPRRPPSKPRLGVPHPPAAPPSPNAPVVSQQVAPLPPPIEGRPAPAGPRPRE